MGTLTQLEYLVAIDDHRHFGKAANACNVSQPSLSLQLQKLEDELGATLFDRSKKPILPTEIGKKIISQSRKVLKEHQRIQQLVDQDQISGKFNLGIIPTLAPYLVPLFVHEFSSRFPSVQLNIIEMKTSEIIYAIKNDRLDGALLVTPLNDDQIIERTLFYEPFCLFHSTDHPLAKRKFIKIEDLKKYPSWLLEEGHCLRNQILNLCELYEGANVLKNVSFKSGNLETLLNLVRQQSGMTAITELARQRLPREEQEKMIKTFSKPVPSREVSLISARAFLKEGVIEELEKAILNNLPNELSSLKRNRLEVVPID